MGWFQSFFWLATGALYALFEKYVLPSYPPGGGWGAVLLMLAETFILLFLFLEFIQDAYNYFGKFFVEKPTNGEGASAGQSSSH